MCFFHLSIFDDYATMLDYLQDISVFVVFSSSLFHVVMETVTYCTGNGLIAEFDVLMI